MWLEELNSEIKILDMFVNFIMFIHLKNIEQKCMKFINKICNVMFT
ncbi:hypothetical protein LDG_5126 [Legionella drancourtii LLAP12]|uniref:Uncharacterized protein n=1 Tax=Legionella drancourtii LLAP12 TaxID=658187 RepID=G9EIW9_9GAMM|nr:hypothetical protein LDG_5126 [Legionella drancourtii LLAP12]